MVCDSEKDREEGGRNARRAKEKDMMDLIVLVLVIYCGSGLMITEHGLMEI
jgi:hypothetical protein